jgi:hypothetical protein
VQVMFFLVLEGLILCCSNARKATDTSPRGKLVEVHMSNFSPT